jgi:fucose permease
VARILDGTGRINAGQGAVITVQGVGASLSPAIGGWIAQELGYAPMFLTLGAFAMVSIGVWVAFASLLKPACARSSDRAPDAIAVAGAG